MTPPIAPAIAFLCFWAGALLLFGMVAAWRGTLTRLRRVGRQWAALEVVLDQRRARLGALLTQDGAFGRACRDAELAHSPQERLLAEYAIDSRLRGYLARGAKGADALAKHLGADARIDDTQAEIAEWQARVADASARYNDAASSLNATRHALPTGILVRAQVENDFPLYEG